MNKGLEFLKMNHDKFSRIKNTITRYDNIEVAKGFYKGRLGTAHRSSRLNKEFELVKEFINDFADKNSIALDIGCSGGRYTEALAKGGFKAYAIDTSFTALKYAKSLNPEAFFVQASVTHLPFKNEKFDLVLCIELMHHFDNYFLDVILKEISRVIKPNGILVCDLRNSLNPIMWYSYRKRDGTHFTLKTRTLFLMRAFLSKHDFIVTKKKNLLFPITVFAPYVIFFCRKQQVSR